MYVLNTKSIQNCIHTIQSEYINNFYKSTKKPETPHVIILLNKIFLLRDIEIFIKIRRNFKCSSTHSNSQQPQ